jgi:hypothetical protein
MHWVILILAFIFLLALEADFRKKTGVNFPSRSALRGIRRRARKVGKNEWEAVAANIRRKQKKLANLAHKKPRKSF